MKWYPRSYGGEADFWRIRQFLREVMVKNDLAEKSWHVARLDYWRWHGIVNCHCCGPIETVTFLWETPAGQLAAVLNPEESGYCHLQVDPAFKETVLEEAMIAFAEANLCVTKGNKKLVSIWADSKDAQRLEILKNRGYNRGEDTETNWRRDLAEPVQKAQVAPGYQVRCLGNESELPARSWASWRGFHPNEPEEKYEGWEWYRNIQKCPLYRRDLDIVAEAEDGSIAAFSTFWYDDVTRTVYIEPVATVPEHRRRGLARAILTEGLARVRERGAVRAFVAGMEPGPDALYSSTLSPVFDRNEQWMKTW